MIYGISIIDLFFVTVALWTILITVEGLRKIGWLHGEYARKAIHVSVGVLLATLPVFMNRREIFVVIFGFLVGIILFSGILHLFKAIEDVPRWTWGQFLYPIGILVVILLVRDKVIYSFAVLELAFAGNSNGTVNENYTVTWRTQEPDGSDVTSARVKIVASDDGAGNPALELEASSDGSGDATTT